MFDYNVTKPDYLKLDGKLAMNPNGNFGVISTTIESTDKYVRFSSFNPNETVWISSWRWESNPIESFSDLFHTRSGYMFDWIAKYILSW